MGETNGAAAALVYEGVTIRRRDEMLCLTDMWRASGEDRGRNPGEWLRSADGRRFAGDLAARLDTGVSRVIDIRRGRNAETYAHWQVGMAYAQYLSTAFHRWCNEVVRGYMEGELPPVASPAPAERGITLADLMQAFAAFGRGFRGEAGAAVAAAVLPVKAQVDHLGGEVAGLRGEFAELRLDVAGTLAAVRQAASQKRRHFSSDTRAELLRAAHAAGGLCPCCRRNRVTNPDGTKALRVEFHHIGDVWDSSPDNGVPLCRDCHVRFTAAPAAMRAEYREELLAFHKFRRRLPGVQAALGL